MKRAGVPLRHDYVTAGKAQKIKGKQKELKGPPTVPKPPIYYL